MKATPRKPKGILDYFPGTPREGQAKILLEAEARWDEADVFVIQAPVGAGKSLIAYTLAAWLNGEKKLKSNILTPTNILVKQYTEQFPRLFCLEKKEAHRCRCYHDAIPLAQANCAAYHAENGEHCHDCCFVKKVRQAHVMPFAVLNYHVMLAHKLYKPVAVFDEAHNVRGMLQSLAAKRLWKKQYNFPSSVTSYGTLLKWLEGHPERETDQKLKLLLEDLQAGRMRYLVEWGTEMLRGVEEECLSLLPLDVSMEKPVLWPQKKVSKIVLASATFNHVDVASLGLDSRRVLYLKAPSPIPPERRPVVYQPMVNMSHRFLDVQMPKLAKFLQDVASREEGKGLVHVTYSVAQKLKCLLHYDKRFRFHDSHNKIRVYNAWRAAKDGEGSVLIAAGLSEGIDLAGAEFGWQIISKIPYPSLEEPAIRYLAENHPERYVWETLRVTAQATGRICRGPEDRGITYIIDENWSRLYAQAKEYNLVPHWLEESIQAGEALSRPGIGNKEAEGVRIR
jgi:Rad3-related DNA helicase